MRIPAMQARSIRGRALALAALGFVALAPFVLPMCANREESRSAGGPSGATAVPLVIGSGPASQPGVEVDAQPPPVVGSESDGGATLVVVIAANGTMFVNGQRAASDEALLMLARAAHDRKPDLGAIINADGAVPHGRVVHVIDLLKQAQIVRIALGVAALGSAAAPASALPPYKGPIPASCAELDAAIQRTLGETACTSDGDCTTGNQSCACAQPMARAAAPKLEALKRAFDSRACASKGPPRPCASCPMPPITACIAGRCAARP